MVTTILLCSSAVTGQTDFVEFQVSTGRAGSIRYYHSSNPSYQLSYSYNWRVDPYSKKFTFIGWCFDTRIIRASPMISSSFIRLPIGYQIKSLKKSSPIFLIALSPGYLLKSHKPIVLQDADGFLPFQINMQCGLGYSFHLSSHRYLSLKLRYHRDITPVKTELTSNKAPEEKIREHHMWIDLAYSIRLDR